MRLRPAFNARYETIPLSHEGQLWIRKSARRFHVQTSRLRIRILPS
jgi:hypothetical protein